MIACNDDEIKRKAKQMADNQRAADKAHHESRVAWLTADAPKLACNMIVGYCWNRIPTT